MVTHGNLVNDISLKINSTTIERSGSFKYLGNVINQTMTSEWLEQGKKHAGKNALLAGYSIPILRSQKLCNKETQFPTVRGRRKKSDEHVKATQR